MRLVHKEPVHAQLFKRHHIVLAVLGLQLFQPRLLMQQPLLAFLADGDFLELGVTHDDGVVVAGGNTGTELLAVVLLEVLFGCHQDVRGRVQTQELRSPLFGQVVGHHE